MSSYPIGDLIRPLIATDSPITLETLSQVWLRDSKQAGDKTGFVALSILLSISWLPNRDLCKLIAGNAWDALPQCKLGGELFTKMKILLTYFLSDAQVELLPEKPLELSDIDLYYYIAFEETSHRYPVPGLR